jgi:diguanylate cyclase (GGDEF)-like protein/PAS domain S-box-containing protein
MTPQPPADDAQPTPAERLRGWILGAPGGRYLELRALLFAILVTALTLGIRLALDTTLEGRPTLVLFTVPILASAYVGGLRAGLLATVLSVLAVSYYILPPLYTFTAIRGAERWQMGTLLLAGVAISLVNEGLHRARLRAEVATSQHAAATAAMRATEGRYRRLFELAPDGIVIADGDGVYTDANESLCTMLGYTHDELVGMQGSDIVVPEELQHITPALERIHADVTYQREWRFRRKDGSVFPADVQARLMPDGNMIAMIRDVSERKRAEERIGRLNRLYAVTSEINALIARAPDRTNLFDGACRIAVETGGIPLAWIGVYKDGGIELPLAAWVGGTPEYRRDLEAVLSRGGLPREGMDATLETGTPVIINDLETDPLLSCRAPALAAGLRACAVLPLMLGRRTIAVLTLGSDQVNAFDAGEMELLQDLADDISFALDHLHKAEKLDYLAYYDELTGLANRALLLERLAQMLRRAPGDPQRTALVLVDIERFKNVNDSLGQATADELLRQVAAWLETEAGDASLVARFGTDRFALVLPEFVHDAEAARFLGKITEGFLRHAFRLKETDYRIAAKFGVALSPGDGADAETLFQHAEAALKKAKASGERYLFYTQHMTSAMSDRMAMESRLRHAVDNGEFVLHYQPKVKMQGRAVVGVEALIRWNDPHGGLVPPGLFIPVLEETGLIDEAGRWALGQAIADHQRWRAAGLAAPRIAVNVSPLQLRSRGFVADIERVISVAADAAAGLELEITESLIMEDVGHSIASLQALRAMGIKVAIDDFGTGFSSLGSLAKLPVDTLKIDRTFIAQMEASPSGMALVTTMINLAHSLKLNVVAEGVETEEQAQLLRLLKCDEMQGFLFSRPLASEQLESRFLARA